MKVVLEHLTKRFPSRNKKDKSEVVAVNDFTFEIPDGKLVGLLGPSGCGKSTSLYMICGLQKPTEGKLFFGEQEVTDLPPEERGVGVVFQNYALYPHLTVLQNITFPLENLKGEAKLTKEQMNNSLMLKKSGSIDTKVNGVASTVYFAPIEHVDWMVAVVVTKQNIFKPLIVPFVVLLLTTILGIILIFVLRNRLAKLQLFPH